MDVTDIYGIEYRAETESAVSSINALGLKIIGLGAFADDSIARVGKISGAVADASGKIDALGRSLDTIGKANPGVGSVARSLGSVFSNASNADAALADVASHLKGITGQNQALNPIATAAQRLARGSTDAAGNMANLNQQLGMVGNHVADVEGARGAMVGLQRSAFGAFKNAQNLGTAVGAVGAKAQGLNAAAGGFAAIGNGARQGVANAKQLNQSLQESRKSLGGLSSGARRFGTAIDSWGARLISFHVMADAIRDVGKALREGQDAAKEGAVKNLDQRDQYRELANLQGKAEPDNALMANAYKFRIATGLDDRQANEALRRFEGGIPFAIQKGNITGDATSGVAGDLIREAARTGIRAGIDGGTSATLAAKLAQSSKITSADDGLAQFQAIIDTLNRGDGDMKPLVTAMIGGAGGMVGDGAAFGSMSDYAAALSSATPLSGNSPRVAATRLRQAFQGIQNLRAAGDGQQNKNLGLEPGQFVENIERLGPLLDGVKDQDAALKVAGIGQETQRRALIGLYNQRQILRKETDTVREAVDPNRGRAGTIKRARDLNDKAFAGRVMQRRVEKARADASKFVQFEPQEETEILRQRAETDLRNRGQIDTPGANADDAMADNFIPRVLYNGLRLGAGLPINRDGLPLGIGGKSTRQMRIDHRAEELAKEAARKAGLDPAKTVEGAGTVLADSVPEERIQAMARAARARGVNPPAGEGEEHTTLLLQQLIRETERTNQILQQQGKPPLPPPLPQANRNANAMRQFRGLGKIQEF